MKRQGQCQASGKPVKKLVKVSAVLGSTTFVASELLPRVLVYVRARARLLRRFHALLASHQNVILSDSPCDARGHILPVWEGFSADRLNEERGEGEEARPDMLCFELYGDSHCFAILADNQDMFSLVEDVISARIPVGMGKLARAQFDAIPDDISPRVSSFAIIENDESGRWETDANGDIRVKEVYTSEDRANERADELERTGVIVSVVKQAIPAKDTGKGQGDDGTWARGFNRMQSVQAGASNGQDEQTERKPTTQYGENGIVSLASYAIGYSAWQSPGQLTTIG